ncbi:MAG: tetratricopeptide repeat protein [Acidobacteriota bacterium]
MRNWGGYSVTDIGRLLGIPAGRIRAYVAAGFLSPRRGRKKELRFTLEDLVLLRTAAELARTVPPRKLRRALERLRAQLPAGRPLSAVRITAEGDEVVVRDGSSMWEPESGQALLNFEVSEIASKVTPLAIKAVEDARAEESLTADEWYDLGCELEPCDVDHARDCYRRALELEPSHVPSCVNLGRILHDAGQTAAAERHYRNALENRPGDPTAAFNLGVALEDLGRPVEAVDAYQIAIGSDPDCADAHFNISRLYEASGKRAAAFRHLKAYRLLVG